MKNKYHLILTYMITLTVGFLIKPPATLALTDCCDYSTINSVRRIDYLPGENKCQAYSNVMIDPDQPPGWIAEGGPVPSNCTAAQTCSRNGDVTRNGVTQDRFQCFDKKFDPKAEAGCGTEEPIIVKGQDTGETTKYGIMTALGCIDTRPQVLITQILKLGIGTGSGVAFLLIIWGSYTMLSSQGQPEKINHGKEIITAAIIGLVFVVLSIGIFQVIGFDILGLGPLGLGTR